MSVAHSERIRLSHRQPVRREPCRSAAPQILDGLYTALRDPDGHWTLYSGTTLLVGTTDLNVLATAMLTDAFPGHSIRPDLVAAFALELPDEGFVLPADLVAGWALRWALA
jgi:hypothetical protein